MALFLPRTMVLRLVSMVIVGVVSITVIVNALEVMVSELYSQVAMMLVVPAATPVTTPFSSIVAAASFEECQLNVLEERPSDLLAVIVKVLFLFTEVSPEMVIDSVGISVISSTLKRLTSAWPEE